MIFKVIIIMCLLFSIDVYAEFAKKITCSTAIFEPYVINNIKERKGIDIDILNAVAKKLNWQINYQYYPWARLLYMAKSKRVNCMFSAAFELRRAKYLDYISTPLHTTRYYIFSKASSNITHLHTLKNKSIGIHRGFEFPEPLASMVVNKELHAIEAKTEFELFNMLSLDRVDTVLTDKKVGEFYSSHIKNMTSFPLIHSGLPTYLTFKKDFLTSKELEQLHVALASVMNDKVLMERISSQY